MIERYVMTTRILDLDMDFFISDIEHWKDDYERLDDEYCVPWKEKRFRQFLESKCRLSKEQKTKGRVITHHHEAFYFWKQLIENGELHTPFEVTHIDAHSDTGLGDYHWVYIMQELLSHPIEDRINYLDIQNVNFCNYLAFALACGWVKSVDFVLHPNWTGDLMWLHLKEYEQENGFFQFKHYSKDLDLTFLLDRIKRIPPISVDEEIPYALIPENKFQNKQPYDYVVFCQSPGYTPKSADYMLDVIKEYIDEI